MKKSIAERFIESQKLPMLQPNSITSDLLKKIATQGVMDLKGLRSSHGIGMVYKLVGMGLVEIAGDQVRITPKGQQTVENIGSRAQAKADLLRRKIQLSKLMFPYIKEYLKNYVASHNLPKDLLGKIQRTQWDKDEIIYGDGAMNWKGSLWELGKYKIGRGNTNEEWDAATDEAEKYAYQKVISQTGDKYSGRDLLSFSGIRGV